MWYDMGVMKTSKTNRIAQYATTSTEKFLATEPNPFSQVVNMIPTADAHGKISTTIRLAKRLAKLVERAKFDDSPMMSEYVKMSVQDILNDCEKALDMAISGAEHDPARKAVLNRLIEDIARSGDRVLEMLR